MNFIRKACLLQLHGDKACSLVDRLHGSCQRTSATDIAASSFRGSKTTAGLVQCLLCRVLLRNAECPRYDQDKHHPKTGVFSRNVRLLQSLAWPNKRPGHCQKSLCLKGTAIQKVSQCHVFNVSNSICSKRQGAQRQNDGISETNFTSKNWAENQAVYYPILSIWRLSPVLCCCAGLTILGIKLFCATCSSAALVRISPKTGVLTWNYNLGKVR